MGEKRQRRLKAEVETLRQMYEETMDENAELREQRYNLISENDRLTLLYCPYFPPGSRSKLRLTMEKVLVKCLVRLRNGEEGRG